MDFCYRKIKELMLSFFYVTMYIAALYFIIRDQEFNIFITFCTETRTYDLFCIFLAFIVYVYDQF